jgi:probable HAF family extracellular repeat protein
MRFDALGKGAIAAICATGFLFSTSAAAAASLSVITPYADPLGGSTEVHGVNNAGWMTGSIDRPDGTYVGFIRDPGGAYTTFSYDAFTQGRAISETNDVAVEVLTDSFNPREGRQIVRSADGSTTTLQNPNGGAVLHGIPGGFNSAGTMVGDFYSPPGSSLRHGYILDGSSFTVLDVPGYTFAAARGINDAGTVVGWFFDGGERDRAYIYSGGAFQIVDHPGANVLTTFFQDVNNHGIAVGDWQDMTGAEHPFTYDINTQTFTDFDLPGGAPGTAWGIDDAGRIVITTTREFGAVSYLYDPNGSVPEPALWMGLILGFGMAGAALRRGRVAKPA